jgi:hypothetical protein
MIPKPNAFAGVGRSPPTADGLPYPKIMMSYRRIYLFAFLLMLLPLSARAADVTLQWDPNTEADLAGYHVAYGLASGSYSNVIDAGNRTSFQLLSLLPGRTYYFAVRAYNVQGLVSGYSTEVSTITPNAALTLSDFFATAPSPVKVGATVAFSISASGGVPPYQYKWLVWEPTKPTQMSSWSTSNFFIWRPAAKGNYIIVVWVRNANSGADAPQGSSSYPFTVVCQAGSVCP